ncbi:hypothetical protein GCM10010211_05400 [Streptomyces albospinus]|uniref:Integral membrane protein n=1 Tax=Streptomyces albospinus TaxID=285515 RepID=A0ABQ2UM83_9ACTN|nr:hypothetical protein [Streptomyces albospinus]GGU44694.1 hypothetical protein GCM10010211_05400 [Streptomyces albospinus]
MGTTTEKTTDDETTTADTTGKVEETGKAEETGAAGTTEKTGTTGKAAEARKGPVSEDGADATADGLDSGDGDEDGTEDKDGAEPAPGPAATGVAAGAGAVVAAGLGLASLTGTWLGTLMAERQTLLGQIKLQSGKATDQIATVYGAPWHTTALVNGAFAVLAVLVAAVVLSGRRSTWVRAVAWGALALGVLGLLVSAGMYFDLFASMPTIPKGPGAAG